jgi:hypothetical protein
MTDGVEVFKVLVKPA